MTTATLEEQERRAYIEGRTAEAELLAAAIDAEPEKAARMLEDLEDLQRENRRLLVIIGEYEDGDD